MFKTRLQELCHKRGWDLPKYTISKEGPGHDPRFQATVTVNNLAYHSHNLCNSSKEAQNDAARLAFLQLSSSADSANTSSNVTSYAPARGISPVETKGASQAPQLKGTAPVVKDDNRFTDIQHLFKNQLQIFTQKRNLALPIYSCEREGPPHASRFRCKVIIDAQTFESLEFFPTIREAEHAAAKLALMSLSADEVQEDNSVYKNVLQELAQKEGFPLPVYSTSSSGEAHIPSFISTVEIEGEVFTGQEARTKKQAEFNAAKTAYTILRERKLSQSTVSHFSACQRQETLEHSFSDTSVSDYQQDNFGPNGHTDIYASVISKGQAEEGAEDTHEPEFCSHHLLRPGDLISVSHLPSDCANNLMMDSGVQASVQASQSPIENNTSTSSYTRVVVCPRVPNMTFPPGSTVMPMSDDKWVAVELNSQSNN